MSQAFCHHAMEAPDKTKGLASRILCDDVVDFECNGLSGAFDCVQDVSHMFDGLREKLFVCRVDGLKFTRGCRVDIDRQDVQIRKDIADGFEFLEICQDLDLIAQAMAGGHNAFEMRVQGRLSLRSDLQRTEPRRSRLFQNGQPILEGQVCLLPVMEIDAKCTAVLAGVGQGDQEAFGSVVGPGDMGTAHDAKPNCWSCCWIALLS